MTLSHLRRILYKAASVIGDVTAVAHGHIQRRVKNKFIGRRAAKLLRKAFR